MERFTDGKEKQTAADFCYQSTVFGDTAQAHEEQMDVQLPLGFVSTHSVAASTGHD